MYPAMPHFPIPYLVLKLNSNCVCSGPKMIKIMNSIDEAFDLLPSKMDSKEARIMLLAIGLQESRFQYRRQLVGNPPKPVGPATGFWQFERGGEPRHR